MWWFQLFLFSAMFWFGWSGFGSTIIISERYAGICVKWDIVSFFSVFFLPRNFDELRDREYEVTLITTYTKTTGHYVVPRMLKCRAKCCRKLFREYFRNEKHVEELSRSLCLGIGLRRTLTRCTFAISLTYCRIFNKIYAKPTTHLFCVYARILHFLHLLPHPR